MSKYEAGNWPPYNVKAIVGNIEQVFKKHDINKLNKPAYHFISQHMGFIAHYGLHGFRSTYEDLEEFAKNLQTGEMSGRDYNSNLHEADRHESDADFDKWYGPAYNKSIAETIRGIVAVARKYHGQGTAPMLDLDESDGGYLPLMGAVEPKHKSPAPRKEKGGVGNYLTRMR